MTASSDLEPLARYANAIRQTLSADASFSPELEDSTTLMVEHGVAFARRLATPDADIDDLLVHFLELTAEHDVDEIRVVDAASHSRPCYRGLMLYSLTRAFAETQDPEKVDVTAPLAVALIKWCEFFEPHLRSHRWPEAGYGAADGAEAADRAWMALSLVAAGDLFAHHSWAKVGEGVFKAMENTQQSDGAFLKKGDADSSETWWFHELSMLHALASFAWHADDAKARASAEKNARFHTAETQPDHATNLPWGLPGFIITPETYPLADSLLHAATLQSTEGTSGINLMLLADTLYCLEIAEY